jgi:hypothetical protein
MSSSVLCRKRKGKPLPDPGFGSAHFGGEEDRQQEIYEFHQEGMKAGRIDEERPDSSGRQTFFDRFIDHIKGYEDQNP